MAGATRGRGPGDTREVRSSSRGKRGGRARRLVAGSSRAFALTIVVALMLHAPLVPTNLFAWLRLALDAKDVSMNDLDGEAIIPIDLDLDLGGSADPKAAEEKPAAADPASQGAGEADAAPPPKPKKRKKPKPKLADAGADASPEARDGGPDASPEEDAGAMASIDAGASDAGAVASADAGAPDAGAVAQVAHAKLKDPVSAAGDPSKLAGENPNVQVLLASDRLRQHELGATFGRLLTDLPQWAAFFEGTGVDPVRDFDHVLLAGPQMRDFRKVVAVMDYTCSPSVIRQAMDTIIARSHGSWLEGTPFPAARVTPAFDKGERILVHVPERRLLVLLPKEAKDQIPRLKSMKGFAKSPVGILLSMVTPGRAFRGLPVHVPDTLKWMRLAVTPKPAGAADVDLELLDDSPEHAQADAAELTQSIDTIRVIDLGLFKKTIVDHIELRASGAMIRGHLPVTAGQLRFILDEVEQFFGSRRKVAQ